MICKLQKGLDAVASWSTSFKMDLSAQKSECSFFNTNKHEAIWRPALCLRRQQIKYNPNPKFLGIAYGRHITYGLHACNVGSKMKQQATALSCLASADWGYDKSILWYIYIATVGSNIEYAAAAWPTWVSISTMEKLEICESHAGRAIIGEIKSTPIEAILAETDHPTVATRATLASTMAMKKSLQIPAMNPRRQIATADVRQRTK